MPLIEIIGMDGHLEDLQVRVAASGAGSTVRPYIAISHVWADGLGNVFSNSLPRCQIAYLDTLTKNLDRFRLGIDGCESSKQRTAKSSADLARYILLPCLT